MAPSVILSAALLFSWGVKGGYDEFFFTSGETDWKCPSMGFECAAPQVCAHEALLDKYYCCGTGSSDAVCWSGSANCGKADNEPATGQIGCSEGNNAFCCLEDREQCTQRFNQVNICWATPANPVANFTINQVNETFSSLSSASPSASSWAIDPATLFSTSTPVSTAASTTGSASASATATGSASPSATNSSPTTSSSSTFTGALNPLSHPSSGSLSGGAIGGIVVGVVGSLAIAGVGFFFLWRQKSNKAKGIELDGNPYHNGPAAGGYGAVGQQQPFEKYAHEAASEAVPAPRPPVEMFVPAQNPVEMEGSKPEQATQYR